MPLNLRQAFCFVFGVWLSLWLLLPLVSNRRLSAQPAVYEAALELREHPTRKPAEPLSPKASTLAGKRGVISRSLNFR